MAMNAALSIFRQSEVKIPCLDAVLDGDLVVPSAHAEVVVFAHGSGSSRLSPRNRMVAGEMHSRGLATLLFDLLTPEEAREEAATGLLRFNIPFLTGRLRAAARWLQTEGGLGSPRIGYFGSSTGAAAALCAAAGDPAVRAVVSRGGRTDLAGDAVEQVQAPTLLIAGEFDHPVIRWNRETHERLPGPKRLEIVRGASHLFEEPHTLEQVAGLAACWFESHLADNP